MASTTTKTNGSYFVNSNFGGDGTSVNRDSNLGITAFGHGPFRGHSAG